MSEIQLCPHGDRQVYLIIMNENNEKVLGHCCWICLYQLLLINKFEIREWSTKPFMPFQTCNHEFNDYLDIENGKKTKATTCKHCGFLTDYFIIE